MYSNTERDGSGSASLAAASMILGIVSIALFMTGLSVFLGALALILAFLSRGAGAMRSHAVTGIITGIVGISLWISLAALSFVFLSSEDLDQYMEQLQEIYREYEEEPSGTLLSSRDLCPVLFPSDQSPEWDGYFLTQQEY